MNRHDEAFFPSVDLHIEPELRPYWDGAREGRLMLARCTACGTHEAAPRSFCGAHPEAPVDWVEATGKGVVYSFTIVHKGEGLFAGVAPYVLAYVELDEGPRLLSNIYGRFDAVQIGAPVAAVFDQSSEAGVVLRFQLEADAV